MRRRIKRIHFVGAGGIGMCGLAELLHNQGYRVTGADLRAGPTVERLRSRLEGLHVGRVAQRFGGGGHATAAAARVTDRMPVELLEEILRALDEEMPPPARAIDAAIRQIFVVETEILTEPCACLCCYNLSVEITDLAPGEYVLHFTWFDDQGEWMTWTDTVVIPDVGQGGAAYVAGSTNSGCFDPTSAGGPDLEASPWGQVKAQYR